MEQDVSHHPDAKAQKEEAVIMKYLNKLFGKEEKPSPDLIAFSAAKKRLSKTLERTSQEIEDNFGAFIRDIQNDTRDKTVKQAAAKRRRKRRQ